MNVRSTFRAALKAAPNHWALGLAQRGGRGGRNRPKSAPNPNRCAHLRKTDFSIP